MATELGPELIVLVVFALQAAETGAAARSALLIIRHGVIRLLLRMKVYAKGEVNTLHARGCKELVSVARVHGDHL